MPHIPPGRPREELRYLERDGLSGNRTVGSGRKFISTDWLMTNLHLIDPV